MMFSIVLQGYGRFPVFYIILLHDRDSAVLANIAQCHLVKDSGRKCFYKLPKSILAGKFQMCLHEQAVQSRWCLSPVLNVP